MEGEENIQELLTKQLVLCQFLCALSILRCGEFYGDGLTYFNSNSLFHCFKYLLFQDLKLCFTLGGNFVCKTFDLYTTFNVGLIYLLYRCFEKICIFKPVTSRPANSERYITRACTHTATHACTHIRKYTHAHTMYIYSSFFAMNKLNELPGRH